MVKDLQAYHAEDMATWGGIDEMMVTRYEAGASTVEERAIVEQAMRDFPAVRALIEFGRDDGPTAEVSEWLDQGDDPDVLPTPERVRPEGSSEPRVESQDIDDFVGREVSRLENSIENPSALLGPQELRWFRDNVVESARAAHLLTTADDDRVLHAALVRKIRSVRRENAMVTSKSSLMPASRRAAEKLLILLNAEDQMLADLQDDEEFSHVGLWYQLAEDAALSDEEIASLWHEEPAIVHAALAQERAGLQVAIDDRGE